MALAVNVASTQWETALYKILNVAFGTGSYPTPRVLMNYGISSADATTIITGYKTYLTSIGSTPNNIATNTTAVSGRTVNGQNTVQSLGDFGTVNRPTV